VRNDTPVARTRNDRIILVRLLCIFGMIYVHVPMMEPADSTNVLGDGNSYTVFELLRALLVDGYGRTSACLLSIVSGFLVAKSLKGNSTRYGQFLKRRFKSIYVPMVVWGIATMLVFSFVSMVQTTFLSDACGGSQVWSIDCLNVILHFSAVSTGPTMHLAFLRDLFVCMLLAPVLIVLILRPLVILGFSVGLTIGLRQINFTWVDRLWLYWLIMVVLLALLTTAFNSGQLAKLQWLFAVNGLDARETLLYPLTRLFGALAIWSITLKLMTASVMNLSAKLEPYLFIAFCSHPLLLSMLQELSGLIVISSAISVLYPAWFVLAPAVSIAAAVLGMRLCGFLLPNLLHLFSGGRIVPQPQATPQLDTGDATLEFAPTESRQLFFWRFFTGGFEEIWF